MKRSYPKVLLIGVMVVLCTMIIAPMHLFANDVERGHALSGINITKGDCGKIGVKVNIIDHQGNPVAKLSN